MPCKIEGCWRKGNVNGQGYEWDICDMHRGRMRRHGSYDEPVRKLKLSSDQVREIRALYKKGEMNITHMAEEYGVSRTYVSAIIHDRRRTNRCDS